MTIRLLVQFLFNSTTPDSQYDKASQASLDFGPQDPLLRGRGSHASRTIPRAEYPAPDLTAPTQ